MTEIAEFRDPCLVAIYETVNPYEAGSGGIVSSTIHYRFDAAGDEAVSRARLRFRSEDELRASLAAQAFRVARVHGDWDRRAPGPDAPELIVTATALPGPDGL